MSVLARMGKVFGGSEHEARLNHFQASEEDVRVETKGHVNKDSPNNPVGTEVQHQIPRLCPGLKTKERSFRVNNFCRSVHLQLQEKKYPITTRARLHT